MTVSIKPNVTALFIGFVGAFFASWLHFPAPWLTGPAIFVSLACLFGLDLRIAAPLRDGFLLSIGITMGATVTPETIATAQKWPISIILLVFAIFLALVACNAVLRRMLGYDRNTALLASSPGHLSYILSLSAEMKSDLTQVSIIQSVRVLMLTLAVPFLIVGLTGKAEPSVNGDVMQMSSLALATTLLLSLLLGFVAKYFKVPAAFLLSGMFVSAFGHVSEWGGGQVPQVISILGFTGMGTLIGTRFNKVSLEDLWKALAGSFAVTVISGGLAIMGAVTVSFLIDVPLAHLLIAFAPGGLETMAAMAFLLDANPAFVAAHHVSRIVFLTFLVPLVLRTGLPFSPRE